MDNIPAFPVFPDTSTGHAAAFRGMTLRDYFAAKAMQAMLSMYKKGDKLQLYTFAIASYQMADTMMEAREA